MATTKDPTVAIKRARAANDRAMNKIRKESQAQLDATIAANQERLAEAIAPYQAVIDEHDERRRQLRQKRAGLDIALQIADGLQRIRKDMVSHRPYIDMRDVEVSTRRMDDAFADLKVIDAKKMIAELLQPYVDAGDIPPVTIVYDNKNGRGGDRSYYIRTTLTT